MGIRVTVTSSNVDAGLTLTQLAERAAKLDAHTALGYTRERFLIPQNLVDFVASEGAEHERYESWVVSEVERGVPLPGLYPPNDEAKARYEAWKKK